MAVRVAGTRLRDGFIEVTLEGVVDGTTDLAALARAIVAACEQHDTHLLLMDFRQVHYPLTSVLREHRAGEAVARWLMPIPQAWLVPPGAAGEALGHMKTVAGNRGAAMRVFRDRGAAEAWLRHLAEERAAGQA